ncbi:MAG TPA: c-type cytochrome [Gemmatimonadaceae bacterium]|nr:c-type cytochrome [Gemmatimonadaceae bacterium]
MLRVRRERTVSLARRNWPALAISLLIAGAHGAAAQGTSAPKVHASPPTGPSTLSGVYTNEQASRGKDVYAGSCRSCHTPASHTGATFNKWWRGKQLSDLFGFISTTMPKNDPGSLAPEDVADVTAYLLKMNAMPVGPAELPPDIDSLKKFRIETKPSRPSPAKRKKP